jgi:hypothetical protein
MVKPVKPVVVGEQKESVVQDVKTDHFHGIWIKMGVYLLGDVQDQSRVVVGVDQNSNQNERQQVANLESGGSVSHQQVVKEVADLKEAVVIWIEGAESVVERHRQSEHRDGMV